MPDILFLDNATFLFFIASQSQYFNFTENKLYTTQYLLKTAFNNRTKTQI
jgi:hypothetical protein